MTDSRSPEDRVAGILRLAVGGVERIVPTLSISATREWQAGLVADVSGVADEDLAPGDTSRLVDLSLDAVLDFVTSYDRGNVLGGRAWLEDHADPGQVYAAAGAIAEVAFPFARNVPMLLGALLARSAAASMLLSSTSSPSPSGGSTPAPSTTASTASS